GIATTVTTPLLYTLFAIVAGVVIVGVGGGLVQPMQNRWENMLDKADQEKDRVQAHLRAQADAEPGTTAYPVDTATTTRIAPPLPRP
ncbi:MAG: Conserved helix repeat-containing protein, partial [Frankiales bacterium]|nr:Conserved helix repeat-containing protein [Frankiales bacterium]